MITAEVWAEVRRLAHIEHLKKKQIARRLQIDVKTVRRALSHDDHRGFTPKAPPPRASMLDPLKPLLRKRLEDHPDLTAVQLHDGLVRDYAWPGGIAVVRRYVYEVRKEQREAFLRLTHLPGKVAQVDWGYCGSIRIGNTLRRLSIFVMVLAYSRLLFACFTLSERMDAFLDALVRALRYFGGIPEHLLFDNMKTVVLDRRAGAVRYHPRLLELSGQIWFKPRTCPPRRPWHKGIVESAIHYVRTSFLPGRSQATDVEREQRDLDVWLAETANVREHAETHRRPIDMFEETEKGVLRPLPDRPVDTAHVETVAANAFFEVRYDGNRYTVPHRYAYRTGLTLRATPGEVNIFDAAEEIARHARSYERWRRIADPKHERDLLAKRRRAHADTLLGRLRGLLPERADEYAAALVKKELRSVGHLKKILALADCFGADEVREALLFGLQHGVFGADCVENLVHQRRRARHAPPVLPVRIADELASIHVPEPNLMSYETLLAEGERSPEHEAAHGPEPRPAIEGPVQEA